MPGTAKDSRLESLRSAPPDSWIALSEDGNKVVAVAATYDEAAKKSETAGVSDPILLRTPRSWLSLSL